MNRKQSLFKALTWRACGTLATTLITLILTKNLVLAGEIGLLDTLFKIVAFYVHERIWENASKS